MSNQQTDQDRNHPTTAAAEALERIAEMSPLMTTVPRAIALQDQRRMLDGHATRLAMGEHAAARAAGFEDLAEKYLAESGGEEMAGDIIVTGDIYGGDPKDWPWNKDKPPATPPATQGDGPMVIDETNTPPATPVQPATPQQPPAAIQPAPVAPTVTQPPAATQPATPIQPGPAPQPAAPSTLSKMLPAVLLGAGILGGAAGATALPAAGSAIYNWWNTPTPTPTPVTPADPGDFGLDLLPPDTKPAK